jgi:hypothetical protein
VDLVGSSIADHRCTTHLREHGVELAKGADSALEMSNHGDLLSSKRNMTGDQRQLHFCAKEAVEDVDDYADPGNYEGVVTAAA